mgnify:CR=1 FL=1
MTFRAVMPSCLDWHFPGGAHAPPDDKEARPMRALKFGISAYGY